MLLAMMDPNFIEKLINRFTEAMTANPGLFWLLLAVGILIAFTVLHFAIFLIDKEEKSNFMYVLFTGFSIFGILVHLLVKPDEVIEFGTKFYPMFFHLITWITAIFLAFLFFPDLVKLKGEPRWKMDKRTESLVGMAVGILFGGGIMVMSKFLDLKVDDMPLLFMILFPVIYFIFHKKVGWWEVSYVVLIPFGMQGENFSFSIATIPVQLVLVMIVCYTAIKRKKSGAWIIFAGSTIFVGSILLQLAVMFLSGGMLSYAYVIGILALSISMAIYLVLNTVKTQVENAEKSQELEQARLLQLSMLPEKTPEHPNYEIAWYMKTATEVGGDYYDYSLNEGGSLILTLGDATGHGMQAGVVVTAAKSLFMNLADKMNITDMFKDMSKSLRSMNLKHLGMAMTVLKMDDHKMHISSAGIPPALIFRSQDRTIEEVDINGMPLGLARNFDYEERTLELNPGDTILLMSDGLPERQNTKEEEFGYPRTQELFKKTADKTAADVCEFMVNECEKWAEGKPQDDDLTLLAIKVK